VDIEPVPDFELFGVELHGGLVAFNMNLRHDLLELVHIQVLLDLLFQHFSQLGMLLGEVDLPPLEKV
jgi:hypothetical protein